VPYIDLFVSPPINHQRQQSLYKYKGKLGGIASIAINLLRVLLNRLQPQSVQVDSSQSNESGRSCIPYENYCDQVEPGGVDGKVIKVSYDVGLGSDESYER
jgi:hypothetical protein